MHLDPQVPLRDIKFEVFGSFVFIQAFYDTRRYFANLTLNDLDLMNDPNPRREEGLRLNYALQRNFSIKGHYFRAYAFNVFI
jgi:hypothetical protein